MPFSSYLPVKASGVGRGLGMARDMGEEEDGRSRRPLPWALPGISTVLAPPFVNGSLQMNGLICPQTVGMNLSVGAGEQEGLRSAERGMNENTTCPRWTSWMHPVPGERRLTSFSGWVEGGELYVSTPGFWQQITHSTTVEENMWDANKLSDDWC